MVRYPSPHRRCICAAKGSTWSARNWRSTSTHLAGKPISTHENSMSAFGELCLSSPEQEIDPAASAAGLGLYETRNC